MKLIEKLKKLRSELIIPQNRDYEFDAELEDHDVKDGNVYRLHYVNFHRINEHEYSRENNVGVIN